MCFGPGSTAVFTGRLSGIGRALVHRLADHGTRVCIVALDDDDLAAAEAEHRHRAGAVSTHGADVGQADQVQAAMEEAVDRHGPCDLLITSAGIVRPGRFLDMDAEQFERQMRVNFSVLSTL